MKYKLLFLNLFFFSFSSKCQFKGGFGDGYSESLIYMQPTINVFNGGQGDGFATAFYNQVSTPLPIKIIYFKAKRVGEFVKLEWQTSSEIDASHFEIERSIDAKAFEKIGQLTINESKKYEFQDQTPPLGVGGLYRLKLIDLYGKFAYSKIIYIANEALTGFQNLSGLGTVGNFYPNPSIDNFANIDIFSNEKSEWIISNIDVTGKILKTESKILEKGLNKITIHGIEKGINIIKFENDKNTVIRKLFK
jgi:Secretion system C-terminal sorting domain